MTYDTIDNSRTIAGNGEGTLLANRYRVVRQLGQGGMGSVWLVEDTLLDNLPFAVKMLPSILVANRRAYAQLKAEALVAMKLTHPNIVTLRAYEENNGNPFLVMDYIDGQTLDECLVERGRLSVDDVLRVLRPIAAALDYAHSQGVVHRDVKPANVMIRKDGTPYILDFGIAREMQETMTRMTGKLSSGTLLYMSPEQLNGRSPTKEQDVYSFAAMAYECLKGEPPFVRGQIEFQILNNPPDPLDLTTGGPSGQAARSASVAASVMAGLSKKPEDRPATCTAVLEGDVLTQRRGDAESQSGRARSPSGPQSGGPRPVAAVKGILVAALLAALAGGAWWWASGRNGTTGTTEQPVVEVKKDDAAPTTPEQPVVEEKNEKVEKTDPAEAGNFYIVKDGDDLVSVSIACGISPSQLMDLNGLKAGDTIKPGDKLKLPAHATKPQND
jgi:serine/threonine-protein kinase